MIYIPLACRPLAVDRSNGRPGPRGAPSNAHTKRAVLYSFVLLGPAIVAQHVIEALLR